jgi:hydrogenase nickel incorporation protein HypA/HybF
MHETGLAEAIVDGALRRADGRRIRGLRVRVGGHPVDPGVIQTGFELAALGTGAEGARLDLVLEPMSVRCADCGHAGPVEDHLSMVACSRCGALDIELTGADEAVLESVTYEATAGAAVDPGTGQGGQA